MSETLTDKLEALDSSADFSDPQTYSNLMGYNDEPQESAPTEPKGETQAEPAAAAPAAVEPTPAKESSATPAAATDVVEPAPAGVATKDGKHVIPMTVLTDTRQALQRANDRARELAEANERLKQELEARHAVTSPTDEAQATDAEMTLAELAEIEADFPQLAAQFAKLAKANEVLQAQVQEVASRSTAVSAEPQVNLQELIDQRPLLSQWQAKGGLAWRAAVEADNELAADPEWSDKPYAERFAEVERRLADDFGIQQVAPTAAPAATPKPGPAQPPAAPVTTTVLPTLTDFNGSPATVGDPMAGMPVGKMVDTAMSMDMEALRRMAGLSY